MEDTEKETLQTMLDDLISDKPENAEVAFHDFVKTKMQNMATNKGMFDQVVSTAPDTETDAE